MAKKTLKATTEDGENRERRALLVPVASEV
jgi:hypothetical protein